MKKLIPLLTVIFVVLAACNKNNPTPDQLESIDLNKDTLTMHVDDVAKLSFILVPSNYDQSSLLWSSSDNTIVSVNNGGKLTAKNVGASIITLTNKAHTVFANCLITVVAKLPLPDSLKIGLIAYYPFNNNGTDESGNGNDGILYDISSVTDRSGKANAAYYFNGSSSYIAIKDNSDLRLSNTDFTINYWVDLSTYNGLSGSAVIEKNNGFGGNGWNCGISGYDSKNQVPGRAFYNVSGGNDPFAGGNNNIPLNTWHMVTVSYNLQKQEITFYVDGMFDSNVENIPTPNSATDIDMFIGKNTYLSAPAYYIQGKLDDIRIYRRKLQDSEIKKLYLLPN